MLGSARHQVPERVTVDALTDFVGEQLERVFQPVLSHA